MAKDWTERIERESYPSNNNWGIPDLKHVPLSTRIPKQFVAYGEGRIEDLDTKGLHFFTYDFKFNTVWTQPLKALHHVQRYQCCLSPDFSMYLDMPRAEQIWNTYRSRWCAAFWESNGVRVIPTIGWSDIQSHEYCFAGIPENSIVAVSTVGVQNDPRGRSYFAQGFRALLETLKPSLILCYGSKIDDMKEFDQINIHYYPQYWETRKPGRPPKENKIEFYTDSLPF